MQSSTRPFFSHGSLIFYINNHNNPFPGIVKVETGCSVSSRTNHVTTETVPYDISNRSEITSLTSRGTESTCYLNGTGQAYHIFIVCYPEHTLLRTIVSISFPFKP